MGRTVAVVWHASFSLAAGALYYFFVLPRWPELLGDTPETLGTALRIATGALIGLAALPVVFTLLRTRKPEYGTPQLALTLRTASIALHVLAGVLIVGTAISEIWLQLDNVGQWLFGIYGAAAAVGLLAIFAFYLAFVAELPPPPPKPLKPKAAKASRRRRGRKKATADESDETVDEAESTDAVEPEPEAETSESDESDAETPAEVTAAADEDTAVEEVAPEAEDAPADPDGPPAEEEADEDTGTEKRGGRLRNRRPSGSSRRKRDGRRSRDGVAVED